MKKAKVLICGRKEPGYPQVPFEIEFSDSSDLLTKIDQKAEDLGWRKVDAYVDPTGLTSLEISELEEGFCIIEELD